ncbi:MAG: IS6 family transposase, partial [Phototrophicaceae bacterium]
AARTLQGYEVMNMIRKGQVKGAEKHNISEQNLFISQIFGLAA